MMLAAFSFLGELLPKREGGTDADALAAGVKERSGERLERDEKGT